MDIIISHKSALEYWRLHGNTKICDTAARLHRKTPPVSISNIADIRKKAPDGLSYPIDILVGSQNAKWKSEVFRPRVYTGPTPDGCFVSIGEGMAVSAPQYLYFQIAGEMPLAKLVQLGLELCGTYTLPLNDEYSPGEETTDKVLYNQPQFTNVKALKAFAARMKGVNGYKKISRALRFIADGSASPMETILFILLTLPYKLGGFGLPAPVLNRRIDIENPAKRGTRKTQYKCDLFWPKAHVAVEYDSDFYHTGADRIARDSKKRLDLEAHGVTVIPMTSRQIRNPDELEKLARLIARRLRKRLQYKNPQFKKAQRELRSLLL